jgi:hypothetical protein
MSYPDPNYDPEWDPELNEERDSDDFIFDDCF